VKDLFDFRQAAQPFDPFNFSDQGQPDVLRALLGEFDKGLVDIGTESLSRMPIGIGKAEGAEHQSEDKDGERNGALEADPLRHECLRLSAGGCEGITEGPGQFRLRLRALP
jgi:hypothetical protein